MSDPRLTPEIITLYGTGWMWLWIWSMYWTTMTRHGGNFLGRHTSPSMVLTCGRKSGRRIRSVAVSTPRLKG